MINYISEDEFEESVLNQKRVILVNFFSKLCPPSKEIESMTADLKYDSRFDIVRIDMDKNINVVRKYGIDSVPTILIFKNGEKKKTITGILEKNELLKIIDKYVE